MEEKKIEIVTRKISSFNPMDFKEKVEYPDHVEWMLNVNTIVLWFNRWCEEHDRKGFIDDSDVEFFPTNPQSGTPLFCVCRCSVYIDGQLVGKSQAGAPITVGGPDDFAGLIKKLGTQAKRRALANAGFCIMSPTESEDGDLPGNGTFPDYGESSIKMTVEPDTFGVRPAPVPNVAPDGMYQTVTQDNGMQAKPKGLPKFPFPAEETSVIPMPKIAKSVEPVQETKPVEEAPVAEPAAPSVMEEPAVQEPEAPIEEADKSTHEEAHEAPSVKEPEAAPVEESVPVDEPAPMQEVEEPMTEKEEPTVEEVPAEAPAETVEPEQPVTTEVQEKPVAGNKYGILNADEPDMTWQEAEKEYGMSIEEALSYTIPNGVHKGKTMEQFFNDDRTAFDIMAMKTIKSRQFARMGKAARVIRAYYKSMGEPKK